MSKQVLFWSFVVLVLLLGGRASALYLKVDFAYPEMVPGDPCFVERFDLTEKDGWFPWADPSFKDCWRHDRTYCATYPDIGPLAGGVDGSGINFQVDSGKTDSGLIAEGGKRFAAYGMFAVTDGGYAIGHPNAEPIVNSGMSTFDNTDKRSVVLIIKGLGPGTYYLESYHNCAWEVDDPNYNNPDTSLGYYNVPDVNMATILVRGPDVTQFITPEDFPIQRERVDANLVVVTTAFTKTDVCDCNVAFMPGSGGKVMLNAFILSTGKWYAREPQPENGATNVCPGDSLCWTSDEEVQFHDVYLGTDEGDVEAATTSTPGIYKGTFARNGNCYTPTGLELGTTYYWRIDGASGTDFWKGDVWSFTTNDGNAFDPFPADGARKIPPDVNSFSWASGCSAVTHDVFFGTSAEDVNNATPESHPNVTYTAGATPGSYDPPGPLAYTTYYYWRVDAVGSGGQRWHGSVWQFKTKVEIDDPTLLVRYQFDELPPSIIAADSSGNEFDGDIGGDPNDWEPEGGRFGGCRIFGGRCTLPADVPKTITSAISISMWLKDLPVNYDENWNNLVLDASSSIVDWRMRIMVPSNQDASGDWPGYILWRAGMEPNDRLSWDFDGVKIDELDDWHHWVFIKDEITQTMKIYFDASLGASATGTTGSNLASMYPNNILICGNQGGGGGGSATVDDFRIYNRTLSDSDVLLVFRGDDLWSAWFPQPRDFATDVAPDVALDWKPGDYTDLHDVYLGTSFDDVNDADTTTPVVYKGRQGPNSYNPGGLVLDTTYYWRVDEVNTTEPNLWEGKTWRFTVANYLVLDDFESYHENLDDLYWFYGGNWLDGIDNGTGSTLYLGLSGQGEPVHTGGQSLYYNYFNSSGYSEAERVINPGERDWTEAGVKMLTLFFYGDPGNDAGATEQMYCGIEDGGSNYAEVQYGDQQGEDMNDLQAAEWHEWNIAISDFTGTTPGDVRSLFIGFGERGSSTAGGSGTIYFDDIRLYLPRCVPDKVKPAYDFSDNCIVDIADVGIMADSWLASDACLPVTAPTDAPVGWWKLDGNANDSAGTAHGTAQGSFQWITGHIDTGAIEFTGDGGRVLVPDAAQLNPTTAVTAMAWVNYSVAPGYSARIVTKGADEDNRETFALQLAGDHAGWFVRDVNTELHGAGSDEQILQGQWAHAAGSYDGDKVRFYLNGRLDGEDTVGSFNLLVDANGVGIGNRTDALDRAVIGAIDDVRIYNVALSNENIAYIATQGSGYVPLLAPVNIYDAEAAGSKAVNFKDLAELMTAWLEQELWP